MSVEERISASAEDFRRAVWPLLCDALGGGELVPVETVTESQFARALDCDGMTDAWQVKRGHGIRAIASRIQWGPTVWASWTIRSTIPSGAKTELHKLLQNEDWHLPSYIVQAYVDRRGGECMAAAAIKTIDLRALILRGHSEGPRENPMDGSRFRYVDWDLAELVGISFVRYP